MASGSEHAASPTPTSVSQELLPPAVEAERAIERTREHLSLAEQALAGDDVEQVGKAYEHAEECADHMARALWFLSRLRRERAAPAAP